MVTTDPDKTGPQMGHTTPQSLKFQHILIITYGRSGSTLLQGILNGIEGVVLRGENENVFFDFYQTYQKLLNLKERRSKSVEPTRPWYGICLFDENQLLRQFQELAKVILLADQYESVTNLTYGFKEIRYNEVGEEFDDYLDFLSKLFPKSAFIFNTRNHRDVASSGWWKDADRDSVIDELITMETQFAAYASTRDHCFSIRYEDVVLRGEQLRNLFDFLGAAYHPEVIETILNTPHSYKPQQEHVKKMFRR
jgi:hypothetical protein